MVREIKFRAKIAGTDSWVIGYPHAVYPENIIDSIQCIDTKKIEYIKIDTLGQFIGQNDKNGVEIYEDDAVMTNYGNVGIVEWYDNICGFDTNTNGLVFDTENGIDYEKLEVIGNIHDNPELRK